MNQWDHGTTSHTKINRKCIVFALQTFRGVGVQDGCPCREPVQKLSVGRNASITFVESNFNNNMDNGIVFHVAKKHENLYAWLKKHWDNPTFEGYKAPSQDETSIPIEYSGVVQVGDPVPLWCPPQLLPAEDAP